LTGVFIMCRKNVLPPCDKRSNALTLMVSAIGTGHADGSGGRGSGLPNGIGQRKSAPGKLSAGAENA
jgi:hypothetical protein